MLRLLTWLYLKTPYLILCEDTLTDIIWRLLTWLYVKTPDLTLCEDSLPDFMWRLLTWLYVKIPYLTLCEDSLPDFMWRLLNWLYVKTPYLTLCEDSWPEFIWRLLTWLYVKTSHEDQNIFCKQWPAVAWKSHPDRWLTVNLSCFIEDTWESGSWVWGWEFGGVKSLLYRKTDQIWYSSYLRDREGEQAQRERARETDLRATYVGKKAEKMKHIHHRFSYLPPTQLRWETLMDCVHIVFHTSPWSQSTLQWRSRTNSAAMMTDNAQYYLYTVV